MKFIDDIFVGESEEPDEIWFNFDSSITRFREHDPTATKVEFLSVSVNVAPMGRQVVVEYFNLQQMLAEVSGSWAATLVVGIVVTSLLRWIGERLSGDDALGGRLGHILQDPGDTGLTAKQEAQMEQ